MQLNEILTFDLPEQTSQAADRTSLACRFCRSIRGEEKSHIVFDDDTLLAFLDTGPVFIGHCLLVPKLHYETLGDLPREAIFPLFKNVQLTSIALLKAMSADGSLIVINNRVSQSVPHIHIHIIPRKKGDGLRAFFGLATSMRLSSRRLMCRWPFRRR
jgi:histidine triad (HIT) family protein